MVPPRFRSTERLAADLPRQVGDLASDALALGRAELRRAVRDAVLCAVAIMLALALILAAIGQAAAAGAAALVLAGHPPVQAALIVSAAALASALLAGWFGMSRLRRLSRLPQRLTGALLRAIAHPPEPTQGD